MTPETYQALAAAMGILGLVVFLVQWLAWLLLRYRRLRPPLWQVLTRSAQRIGAAMLVIGIITWFAAPPAGTILAQIALLSGLLNVVISTMYLVIYRALCRAESARGGHQEP